MIDQAQPAPSTKPSKWPLVILIGVACLGGLVMLALMDAFYVGFMNGYNGARYRAEHAKGDAAYDRGDYLAAADDYSAMIALRPRSPVGYHLRGACFYQMYRYTAAVTDETSALRLYHGKDQEYISGLYYNRGLDYEMRGDYAPALADYTQALHSDATNTDALRERAWTYEEAHSLPQAIADTNALIAQRPMWGGGYVLRADILRAASDHAHAAADYFRAMQLSPEDTDAYEHCAQMCDDDGKDDYAVRVTQTELRAHPDSATCWGSLGWWQYKAGDLRDAIASSRHALSIDDHLAYVWLNIGLCYAVQGNWPMAQQTYANVLPYCRQADVQAGENDLQNALKRHPHQSAIQQALSLLQNPTQG